MVGTLLASDPTAALGSFALAAGAMAIHAVFPHLRWAFDRWRIDRQLARHPHIRPDERDQWNWAIAEELEPLDGERVITGALLAGALAGAPVWLAANGLEHWWQGAVAAFIALSLLTGLWRWLNDPESKPAAEALADSGVTLAPGVTLTAVAASAGALLLTGLLLLSLAWLV